MKTALALPAVALCGLLLAATTPAQTQKEQKDNTPPPGFTALFNGKDLTGWQGLVTLPQRKKLSPEQYQAAVAKATEKAKLAWTVQDGVIRYNGKDNNLQTAKDYGNFELYVDWKIGKKGDSGLYLRGNPQVQIWDNPEGSGSLWNNRPAVKLTKKSLEALQKGGLPQEAAKKLETLVGQDFQPYGVFTKAITERFAAGELKMFEPLILKHAEKNRKLSGAEPLVFADNPVGQWNTFHIIMKGDKVTIDLNGKRVVDGTPLENYWERGQPLPARGPIELQHHGDPLWFKNIFIKELPD